MLRTRARQSSILILAGLLIAALLVTSAGRAVTAQQSAEPTVIARITIKDQAELLRLVTRGLDLLEMREGDDLFILTTATQIEQLRGEGWTIRVDERRTTEVRARQSATVLGGYRSVAEMRAFLDVEAAQYPSLAEVFVYGHSWQWMQSNGAMGYELSGIKLTNKNRPGPKPTFFLMAAIHAREMSTSELALRLVDYLLSNYGVDGDATWLLDEHLVVVVPVVNPDGRVIAEQGYYQRKNTNATYGGNCAQPPTPYDQFGVDLNRNSHFKWGTINAPSESKCGQTYPGPTVASEPEISSLETLVRSLFADQRGPNDNDPAPLTTTGTFITLHSYSNLVLWPWGWTYDAAPNAAQLSLIGQKFAAYNGFTPQQATQLYPTSGTTDDWAYGELGIAAFTFEVGSGSGPCGGFFPPFSCLDGGSDGSFWPRNLPALLYAARIARAPYLLAQGPTPESATATLTNGNSIELRVQLDAQHNGGQNIAAAEYYLDTPPWSGGTAMPMTALDGSFNSTVETATAIVAPLTGRHLFYVRGQDAQGHWGPVRGVFSPCSFSLGAPSQSFTASGGSNSVAVTTAGVCQWSTTSNASFITINAGNSVTGNGTVTYTVAENTGAARSGTLTIAGQRFTIYQGAAFNDVLPTDQFYNEIGKLSARGITVGCGDGNYCPEQMVTREQMAVFIERALGVFTPPTPATQRFLDVAPSRSGYAFIADFAARGITLGCGPQLYCPDQAVTREQMAVFIERALGIFTPPTPTVQRFLDVAPSRYSYPFIDDFATRGITNGCGPQLYCPDQAVTRAQMAAFLVRAFNL